MKKGFTVIELSIVIGILATLIGLISINVFSASAKASVHTTITTVIADLAQQRLLAMKGNRPIVGTGGNFGIYFAADRYTLFFGPSYDPASTTNFVVKLTDNLQFSSIQLPMQSIIFAQGSGEVVGFNPSEHTLTLTDTNTNEQQAIEINRRGGVTNVY